MWCLRSTSALVLLSRFGLRRTFIFGDILRKTLVMGLLLCMLSSVRSCVHKVVNSGQEWFGSCVSELSFVLELLARPWEPT